MRFAVVCQPQVQICIIVTQQRESGYPIYHHTANTVHDTSSLTTCKIQPTCQARPKITTTNCSIKAAAHVSRRQRIAHRQFAIADRRAAMTAAGTRTRGGCAPHCASVPRRQSWLRHPVPSLNTPRQQTSMLLIAALLHITAYSFGRR